MLAQRAQRALDVGHRRVGLDVAVAGDRKPGGAQLLDERARRPLLEQEVVGHHERALDAEAAHALGERVGGASADHDVAREVELDHRTGSIPGRSSGRPRCMRPSRVASSSRCAGVLWLQYVDMSLQ